jgi:hypothetical protein
MKGPLPQNASDPTVGMYKNSAFVGPYAVAVMGTSSTYQSHLNTCYTSLKGLTGEAYFPATLRVISLFNLTGNFWKPSDISAVDDQEIANIAMYPNPFTSSFHIENAERIETIEIVDAHGKTIETLAGEQASIELGNAYPKGIYFVRLSYSNKNAHFKIMKQ